MSTTTASSMVLTVNPSEYETQLQAKVQRIQHMFEAFRLPPLDVYTSTPSHYRQRCEFNVRHDGDAFQYAMFVQPTTPLPGKRKAQPVPVETFPVASQLINELMSSLRTHLSGNPLLQNKLFQINFHTTTSGHAMVTLLYHKKLDDAWVEAAKLLRTTLQTTTPSLHDQQLAIVGRSRGQKVELDCSHVIEQFTVNGQEYSYMQVEGSFSQPNGGICEKMLTWAQNVTTGSTGDLLELYCGNGNFTIPLARNFTRVIATEVAKSSVDAARFNIEANKVSNIFIARMSSEEFTEAWNTRAEKRRLKDMGGWDSFKFSTILVDPPRAGLDDQTVELLKRFDNIVYISCNPETLRLNLETIRESHEIKQFAMFDQFPYTEHLECGVYLQRVKA